MRTQIQAMKESSFEQNKTKLSLSMRLTKRYEIHAEEQSSSVEFLPVTFTSMAKCHTVLLGAKERGVERCSLVSFLIFSIPADLRSYLRSNQLASMQYKAQGLHIFRIRISKSFLSLNS